ncbi:probable methyltransferase PMT5 [Papaver somniferum]|uniref:probable methyltransferase PMT5 n=1 Tax=Papaver somniferum TaxID=3469 RepID=UPI000E6F4BA1|nr:probable methyltransferase PMT5 [Papaver somniferum]XP_026377403.1 probable methyltransferase PMT5 [Papaver somniferum]XP_026377404.1 probable methyltransferase PMT5 [Papaver somniferum]XP_026377405.1 probable methyltransferase PMT5 [Papaver somniferum]
MRSSSSNQHIVNFGRSRQTPPLSLLLLCFVCVVVIIVVLGSTSSKSLEGLDTSAIPDYYNNYRRLKEQAVSDFLEIRSLSLGITNTREFELCGKDRENHVPCYNVSANLLAGFHDGEEFDRHCEVSSVGQRCLVRPPKDYKIPLRWPAGKDIIWSGNVKITKDQFLSSGSMTKRLMLLEENQIAFHSEDGMNIDGVKDYSRQVAEMIGLGSDTEFRQAGVQTVLDIGCGFGSFGAHLLSLNLMTVCIAAYEVFGSQVQLALERGLPAMIGDFISKQLPYPSLSFDMVHCAQCGITWDKKDGAFLIEVDRLLKPGGYFVLTSPTTNPQGGSLNLKKVTVSTPLEEFTESICWSLLAQQEETFVWQKTSNVQCYASRKEGSTPPICKADFDGQSYYQPLRSCLSGTTSKRWIPIQNRSTGSHLSSAELEVHGVQPDDFQEDTELWRSALRNYWSLLTPLIFSDHPKRPGDEDPLPPFNMIRNVMDMNAHYGGLNVALLEEKKSAWVMNVVPIRSANTLSIILDRGFAGVLHDWCEPFPTYPRTYDMLHANGLLTYYKSENCEVSDLFLEMDRILRPEGWVVLRDKFQAIEKARSLATQIRWEARVIELQNDNDQRLLVCQKPFWKK